MKILSVFQDVRGALIGALQLMDQVPDFSKKKKPKSDRVQKFGSFAMRPVL